jgi:hypothetical protein
MPELGKQATEVVLTSNQPQATAGIVMTQPNLT